MDKILNFFDFTNQIVGYVFARFGIELVLTCLVVYLTALIILQITKKKDHKIGFSNWFKVCYLYGIVAAESALGIIVILTIRANGLHFFAAEALSWTWYCGYLLMSPEILLIIGLIGAFIAIQNNIKKSIN